MNCNIKYCIVVFFIVVLNLEAKPQDEVKKANWEVGAGVYSLINIIDSPISVPDFMVEVKRIEESFCYSLSTGYGQYRITTRKGSFDEIQHYRMSFVSDFSVLWRKYYRAFSIESGPTILYRKYIKDAVETNTTYYSNVISNQYMFGLKMNLIIPVVKSFGVSVGFDINYGKEYTRVTEGLLGQKFKSRYVNDGFYSSRILSLTLYKEFGL